MGNYILSAYACPYCGTKSNASICLHADCLRLAELNRLFREAKTAQLQIPLALEANKLREKIRERSQS